MTTPGIHHQQFLADCLLYLIVETFDLGNSAGVITASLLWGVSNSKNPELHDTYSSAFKSLVESGHVLQFDGNTSVTEIPLKSYEVMVRQSLSTIWVTSRSASQLIDSWPPDYHNRVRLFVEAKLIEEWDFGENVYFRHEQLDLESEILNDPASIDELNDQEINGPEPIQIPASDRIVSLDDNSTEFKSTISAIEVAEKAITKTNMIGADEKDPILKSLELGKELLKSGKFYVTAASVLILQPLYSAYASLAEEGAKQLIMAAIKAVASLIGVEI